MANLVTLWAVSPPNGGEFKLIAAALPKDLAEQAILKNEPPGSTAELATEQLNDEQIATLDLPPGEIIEYSMGMKLGRRK